MSRLAAVRSREWEGQIEPRFQGKGVVPGNIFLISTKLDIFLSDSANCIILPSVVLTQYRRVTDRRTDIRTGGIAVASIALAMRALRRGVKK